jgi:hypothetical protein
MRVKVGLIAACVALAVLGFGVATLLAHGAAAHSNPCHSRHTCPSDHHTYVWTDLTTGLSWDCAEPGASEYDATRETTVIVYDALTYYCRSASASTTTASISTATTATESTSTTTTTTVTTATTTTTTGPTTTFTTPGPGLPSIILPNPKITPGALNPKVRQSTTRKTICKSGWTKKIRPPVSYTSALKIQQMILYEETDSPSAYEEDHFIPLELGGAPRNPKNLWPEPRSQSMLSDPLETSLKRKVCRGLRRPPLSRRPRSTENPRRRLVSSSASTTTGTS